MMTSSLERTSDEEQTAVKLLQEDYTLARKTTSKKDQNGTGGDAGAENGFGRGFARGL